MQNRGENGNFYSKCTDYGGILSRQTFQQRIQRSPGRESSNKSPEFRFLVQRMSGGKSGNPILLVSHVAKGHQNSCLKGSIFPDGGSCQPRGVQESWVLRILPLALPSFRFRFHLVDSYSSEISNDTSTAVGSVAAGVANLTMPDLTLSNERLKAVPNFIGPFLIIRRGLFYRQIMFQARLDLNLKYLAPFNLVVLIAFSISAPIALRQLIWHTKRPRAFHWACLLIAAYNQRVQLRVLASRIIKFYNRPNVHIRGIHNLKDLTEQVVM